MDFDAASIDVNAATANWGPYRFNFRGALPDPDGDPIQTATVKSYLNATETTAQLIDASLVTSPEVQVWFNYPGAQYLGRHTLIFTLTTQAGGVKKFEFGFAEVA